LDIKSNYMVLNKNSRRWAWGFLLASFMLCSLTTDGVIGKYAYMVASYYHFITYGVFMLMGAMMICTPEKAEALIANLTPENISIAEA
jgi:hypothetical protein